MKCQAPAGPQDPGRSSKDRDFANRRRAFIVRRRPARL